MAFNIVDHLSAVTAGYGPATLLPFLFTVLALVLVLRPLLFPSKVAQALRNLPGPKPVPVLGNLVEFFMKGYHTCHLDWLIAYGPVFQYDMGQGNKQLTIADPELVQQVGVRLFKTFHDRPRLGFMPPTAQLTKGLVFSRGDYWTGVRSTLVPMFHSVKLQFFGDIMHECASILVQRLEKAAQSKQAVNLKDMSMEMTLDVLGSSAFGVTFDNQLGSTMSEDNVTIVKAVTQNMEDFAKLRISTIIALMIPPLANVASALARQIPGTADFVQQKRTEFIAKESQRIIDERRKEGDAAKDRHDFLTMLAQATDKSTGEPLSGESIEALVTEFLAAGSETTATTIAFAVYCITTHPAVEKKVIQEIDAFYSNLEKGDVSRRPTYDELAQFPYVEQVVQETLRMYPAGALIGREAQEDCTVGDMRLPKGTPVMIPIYAMHHNPKVFPEPDAFKPERFAPEEIEKRHPYAYIPFGLGPRMCIGHRFAMEEAKLALIRIYRKMTFQLVPEKLKLTPGGKLELLVGLVLKPKNGMWVVPQMRSVA